MGLLIKADFKKKLDMKLYRYDCKHPKPEYHADIFCEMFSQFPQFKAHVSAYIERHYCFVVNDDDHPRGEILLNILNADEIRKLNEWVLLRNKPGIVVREK